MHNNRFFSTFLKLLYEIQKSNSTFADNLIISGVCCCILQQQYLHIFSIHTQSFLKIKQVNEAT